MAMAQQPDRYEPLPSPLGLPAFFWRKLSRTGRRIVAMIGVALVAGAVALAALVLPDARLGRDERTAADASRARAAKAERLERIAREGRPQQGRGPAARGLAGAEAIRTRRRLIAGLEAVILADARQRAARGELRGPYRSTACFEFPKRLGQPPPADDPRRRVARFECVAVAAQVPTSELSTGSLIGQPFRARVDFVRGRFAWCKFVQRPGELSIERPRSRAIARTCGG
jgi:hypothetical protein